MLASATAGTFVGSMIHAGCQVNQWQRERQAGAPPAALTLRLNVGVVNSMLAFVLARLMDDRRRVAFVSGALLSALADNRFD